MPAALGWLAVSLIVAMFLATWVAMWAAYGFRYAPSAKPKLALSF